MNSSQFVIKKLQYFIKVFPQTKVRYENDELSRTHFIEVVPNSVYYLDESYIKWELSVIDEFITLFPSESICFISDDALVGIENAEFILIGEEFVINTNTTVQQIGLIESAPISEFEINFLDRDLIHNYRSNIEYNVPISLISFNNKNNYPSIACKPVGEYLRQLAQFEECPLAA